MYDAPEYSVGCTDRHGRQSGRCFDIYDEAAGYFSECAASGRYMNVGFYDAADNLLDEWMADECDDDFETRNPHLSAQHSEQFHRGMQ